jgi:hypothetical protein
MLVRPAELATGVSSARLGRFSLKLSNGILQSGVPENCKTTPIYPAYTRPPGEEVTSVGSNPSVGDTEPAQSGDKSPNPVPWRPQPVENMTKDHPARLPVLLERDTSH